MATTPTRPRRSIARTPPTPVHGPKLDHYEPFSPRRSTRSTTQRLNNENKLSVPSINFSPPLSTHGTPAATRHGAIDKFTTRTERSFSPDTDVIMSDAASDAEMMATADELMPGNAATMGMLPTPAKTPRKKELPGKAFDTTARILFPPRSGDGEDVMPSPRKKKGRERLGLVLDEAADVEDDEPIPIYTDSKDRVPELDTSADNPFWDQPKNGVEAAGNVKDKGRTKVLNKEMEKALKRTDGAVYIFRGRKFFRKFDQDDDDDDGDGGMMSGARGRQGVLHDAPVGRLTRSSIKPRLLFPTEEQKREREQRDATAMDEDVIDEEATTEIDEDALNEVADGGVHSDSDDDDKDLPGNTPSKGKGGNSSSMSVYHDTISGYGSSIVHSNPPSSVRITRSITKRVSQSQSVSFGQVNNDSIVDHIQTPVAGTHAAETGGDDIAETTTNGGSTGRRQRKKRGNPFSDWRRVKKPRSGSVNGSSKAKVNHHDSKTKTGSAVNRRSTRSSTTVNPPTTTSTGSPISRAAQLDKM
ncbi:MAG: hypothetical protein M1823_003767 [Watsoniomyces obsoletus]|nr:MAG: hypothetical protein M1823_003767 [Watsoniomyces obsoletus]